MEAESESFVLTNRNWKYVTMNEIQTRQLVSTGYEKVLVMCTQHEMISE